MKTKKPDGPTARHLTRVYTRDEYTHSITRAQNSPVHAACAPVGPSGAPIGAGIARRDTRRDTCRAVGLRARLSSPLRTHKKIMEKAKPMRQAMPYTTSIIDDFRSNWPEAGVVQAVRAGLDSQPTFHATENGQEVGTPIPYDPDKASSCADLIAAGLLVIGQPQPPKKGPRRG